jgi:hypothetical protein
MLRFESVISQSHKMKDNLTEFSLDPEIYNLALAYASEQANLENGQKVFYNTMTVWAVNHLLGWMEFETILDKDDDWTLAIEAVLDLADLMLPGIGKIQCCRICEGETEISVPVQNDRIAYIFVELPESLDKSNFWAFSRLPTSTAIL